jgi:hypothetical protein
MSTESVSVAPSMTFAQLAALPATVDVVTAGKALGIGRTTAYALVRTGQFPCSVIRVRGTYRVPTVGLLRLLEINPNPVNGPESAAAAGTALGLPRDTPAARV